MIVKKQATEEKYGRLVKEKKLFEEKERILLNTFESLKELGDLRNRTDELPTESPSKTPVIDITGEEASGGSTSSVFSCEQCSYKSAMKERLVQHIKAKHEEVLITCELCEFAGKPEEFIDHMKHNHTNNDENKRKQEKGKKSSNKNGKAKNGNGNVIIPCDVCSFVGKTAADIMKNTTRKVMKHAYPVNFAIIKLKHPKTLKNILKRRMVSKSIKMSDLKK